MNNQTDTTHLTKATNILIRLTKTTPFKHQAIEATNEKRYFGLFMEQGTGKTHVTIATFTHLYRTGKINGVLILSARWGSSVPPSSSQSSWVWPKYARSIAS